MPAIGARTARPAKRSTEEIVWIPLLSWAWVMWGCRWR